MAAIQLCVDSAYLSPYALSAFVGLVEKALPFELVELDLSASENLAQDFAKVSITRRVPTLVHEGFALSESSAITEYLEERFPNHPLYPNSIQARARARQIQAWLRSDLMPIRQERPTDVVFCRPTDSPLSAAAIQAANKLFFAAEQWLNGNATQLFDEWSIADVDLALMLNRLVLNGDEVPAPLAAYACLQWQRPSVQRWVKMKRPLS